MRIDGWTLLRVFILDDKRRSKELLKANIYLKYRIIHKRIYGIFMSHFKDNVQKHRAKTQQIYNLGML